MSEFSLRSTRLFFRKIAALVYCRQMWQCLAPSRRGEAQRLQLSSCIRLLFGVIWIVLAARRSTSV